MLKPPYKLDSTLLDKASQIQLALFDVDGVLTNGSLFYSGSGEELKCFNVLDGQGIKMLRENGIAVGIISAKKSGALNKRLNDLDIEHQFTGVSNKLDTFKQLISTLNIDAKKTCFTGDDVIDIAVMRACGLSFSVNNAHYSVKETADWITPMSGGSGAVRAICDTILYAKSL